ncbi:MAG: class B sortase [Oscillospiraceae bacterium]|nr:class B sortase [Oscillospiraceae bacterium]
MSNRNDKSEKRQAPKTKGWIIYVSLIVIGLVLIGFALFRLISGHLEYTAARNEYQQLREIIEAIPMWPVTPQETHDSSDALETVSVPRPGISRSDLPTHEEFTDPMETLLEKNPDFIGWIRLEGVIDYPVVQGRNNVRYLNTTFRGERNSSGAIFMDYRNDAAFNDEVTIIYGHNMRDGSMFAPLHRLRDAVFLEENQYISMVTSDWRILTYRIFAVRVISAWDTENDPRRITSATLARTIRTVPETAEHILILSTCTFTADDSERLRVYAVRIDYIPGAFH